MFKKILIANRGEIAVRIIRACREMGIAVVAVYSEADKESLHVHLADEAVCIGPAASKDSYLKIERILSATVASGSDAIHPGFGFLSENAKFADLCSRCNITFIGPSADVIERMGNKSEARNTVMKVLVPVVPGTKEAVYNAEEARGLADKIGYPILIKASGGGGGKGMRVCRSSNEFTALFNAAQKESKNYFSDSAMYIEKYMEKVRHIEFQILADNYGNVIHLGERDCSMQRRHQKLIEEAPSMALKEELRRKMGEAAVAAAKACGYRNAGTIEFILDEDGNYYFIEMNTRIQVEHGITELITGIDLIKEQIKIAAGAELSYKQEDIHFMGHAIECRINAESPKNNFMPCPGSIEALHMPGGFGVRVDSAIYTGYQFPPFYDSLAAKVMVHDIDRASAISKMKAALNELVIEGIETNKEFSLELLNDKRFINGKINTAFVEEVLADGA